MWRRRWFSIKPAPRPVEQVTRGVQGEGFEPPLMASVKTSLFNLSSMGDS